MILFKTNFCIVFLTINLVHNSFSVDDKKTNDEICDYKFFVLLENKLCLS